MRPARMRLCLLALCCAAGWRASDASPQPQAAALVPGGESAVPGLGDVTDSAAPVTSLVGVDTAPAPPPASRAFLFGLTVASLKAKFVAILLATTPLVALAALIIGIIALAKLGGLYSVLGKSIVGATDSAFFGSHSEEEYGVGHHPYDSYDPSEYHHHKSHGDRGYGGDDSSSYAALRRRRDRGGAQRARKTPADKRSMTRKVAEGAASSQKRAHSGPITMHNRFK